MKIISVSQAKKFKNSDKCFGLEYPHNNKHINGAVITITGRYPDKGRVVNTVCTELVYILSGSGKLVCEGKTSNFAKGDMMLVDPNERYYWDGKFEMLIVCTPAFYYEQHKEVK